MSLAKLQELEQEGAIIDKGDFYWWDVPIVTANGEHIPMVIEEERIHNEFRWDVPYHFSDANIFDGTWEFIEKKPLQIGLRTLEGYHVVRAKKYGSSKGNTTTSYVKVCVKD